MRATAREGPHDVDVGDGLRLHADVRGAGRTMLLLHGFTGAGATWAPLRASLGAGMRTIAVDMPGHAASSAPESPSRYALPRLADDLAHVLDTLGEERAIVLGYSMGGRAALHLAHRYPERVSALVLESASPGLADATARNERQAQDDALADDVEREGMDAFVARWARLPLWASQRALPSEVRDALRAQRLANDARGLANSLRGAGAGVTPPLEHALPGMRMRALWIAGSLDAKYVAIARACAAVMPEGRLAVVDGAGHAVHLEQPGRFAELVREFVRQVPQAPSAAID